MSQNTIVMEQLKQILQLKADGIGIVVLTVQRNHHIQRSEDHLYYSVPYHYVGKKVKVLYNKRVVEVYLNTERIALHLRKPHCKACTTLAEYMPPHHQRMQTIRRWNKEDLLSQATAIGPATEQAATLMLENSIYVEQNYKACFGMLMLQKKYCKQRLEAACSRALQGTRINYTMIRSMLERALDKQTPVPQADNTLPLHGNIRGKENYQ